MIWIGVLGAAFVSGKNLHVAIDILPKRQTAKTQKRLQVVVALVIILFVLFAFVIGGFRLVYVSHILGQQSPALQIPLAVVYVIIPISGLLNYVLQDLRSHKFKIMIEHIPILVLIISFVFLLGIGTPVAWSIAISSLLTMLVSISCLACVYHGFSTHGHGLG